MGSRNHLRFLGADWRGLKNWGLRFAGKGSCWEGRREESSCLLLASPNSTPLSTQGVNRPGGLYVKQWANFSQQKSGHNLFWIVLLFFTCSEEGMGFTCLSKFPSLCLACGYYPWRGTGGQREVWASHHCCSFHPLPEIKEGGPPHRPQGSLGGAHHGFRKD